MADLVIVPKRALDDLVALAGSILVEVESGSVPCVAVRDALRGSLYEIVSRQLPEPILEKI